MTRPVDPVLEGSPVSIIRPSLSSVDADMAQVAPLIEANPFVWRDPQDIPPRRWLYGRHWIRGFVSATVAPGGVGKSALTMAEAMAVATGRDLLGVLPNERTSSWVINLEDDAEELARRTLAITQRFGLTECDLSGRLFLNSGRDGKVIIADTLRNGVVIARPLVESLVAQIKANRIGLVIVDPFVASHAVPENDNGAINQVLSVWREIAHETDCAIELVHHTRKTNGAGISVEDGRGGSALHGAVRSMRALNPMTEEEALRAGVENRRAFFRVDAGKLNLAPPPNKSNWYTLASIDLGNETSDRPSDHVGVAIRWHWPDPLDAVTADHLRQVQEAVAAGDYRKDSQSPEWAGHAIGRVLKVDTGPGVRGKAASGAHRAARAKVTALLNLWIENGALVLEEALDQKRNKRLFVRAGVPC